MSIALVLLLLGCQSPPGQPAADTWHSQRELALPDLALPDHAPSERRAPADQASPDLGHDAKAWPPDLYQQPLPALGSVTLYVNLGDSIAAGYGVSGTQSFRALLYKNDDTTYPAFKGKDLSTTFPGITVSNRAVSGATSKDLAQQLTGVPSNVTGDTLVIICVGGNDIMNSYVDLLSTATARALAQKVQANIDNVLAHFASATRYGGKTTFLVFNVYDFTDGMGTLPANAVVDSDCALLKNLGPVVGPMLLGGLATYNAEMAQYAKTKKVVFVDLHVDFLGHGFNYNNTSSLFYDPLDPTLWFRADCIHPNVRGHHEIRSLIWSVLFGT